MRKVARLKALLNEDTLLRTHCCPWCFLGCANWETFVVKHFLCPGHKICVRNKCCVCRQMGKHLCRQQCVHNNVSSFARAFRVFSIERSTLSRGSLGIFKVSSWAIKSKCQLMVSFRIGTSSSYPKPLKGSFQNFQRAALSFYMGFPLVLHVCCLLSTVPVHVHPK